MQCPFDLFNREIIGYSARRNKDAILVSLGRTQSGISQLRKLV